MSPEQIASLNQELSNTKANMDGMDSALTAHKGMLNDVIQTALNLRTTVTAFQKANQQVNAKLNEANKQIASLNQQVTDATATIEALKAQLADITAKFAVAAQAA